VAAFRRLSFISDGKFHDVNVLDHLVPEPGAFYAMDRAYIDLERLARLNDVGSFFVTRAKSNFRAQRRYSLAVDRATGLVCDQTVVLTGFYSRKGFEAPLRRIKFNNPETGKRLVFLTNNFALPAPTITQLYRLRWRVELFFQVDQTASANQGVLRHSRECSDDANPDRRVRPRP
jgi:Transposase DDE domain